MTPLKKLLIVDDEPDIHEFLQLYFSKRGFEVRSARSKEKALSVAKEFSPHIILQDIRLSGNHMRWDGIALLEEYRKFNPNVKVIMISGLDDEEISKKALALGAVDYILKPITLEYLDSIVAGKIKGIIS